MHGASQFSKSLLCRLQVSRLQRLPDGCEIVLPLPDPEFPAASERTALTKILNCGKLLPGPRQIARYERLTQFLQIRIALLKVRVHILMDRIAWKSLMSP